MSRPVLYRALDRNPAARASLSPPMLEHEVRAHRNRPAPPPSESELTVSSLAWTLRESKFSIGVVEIAVTNPVASASQAGRRHILSETLPAARARRGSPPAGFVVEIVVHLNCMGPAAGDDPSSP